MERLGRFRLGNKTNANKYWLKEEESADYIRKTILKHIVEECRISGDNCKDWKEVVRDDGRHIAILHGIKWKRKREE